MFPRAFDYLQIRALPMISSWDIYCKFVLLPTKSKVYKFLNTEVIPDLNLNESYDNALAVLNYRKNWNNIIKSYGIHDDSGDSMRFYYGHLIKRTSFGHWCSLDADGFTFPDACFQIDYYKYRDKTIFPIQSVYKYFDALPFPGSYTVDILHDHNLYEDFMIMLPDDLTDRTNSTEALIEDYAESKCFTDTDKEYDILRSIAANGKFHLFNSYFEHYGKQCTLPMLFGDDDVIDEFNKKYGHHYNYNLRDSKGKSLIFYNQRQSTIERTSKKEIKRYTKYHRTISN
jgi:hypothetical protein